MKTPTISTTRQEPSPLSARRTMLAVGNEVTKGLLHGWAERWQIVFETAMFAAMFLLFAGLVGQGEQIVQGRFDWALDPERTAWLFVGFAAFMFYFLQTQKLFWRLLGEIQEGTLEQVYLSPLPSWVVAAAGRLTANVIETAAVVMALYAATLAATTLPLSWNPGAVVALAGLVVASVGASLCIGGLTLRWKRLEVVNDGLHVVVLFLGGVMVPLDQLPTWMAAVGRYLPVTHPIEALRITLAEGDGLAMSGDGGLAWLTATAIGWLVLGVIAFHLGDTAARRTGTLAHY